VQGKEFFSDFLTMFICGESKIVKSGTGARTSGNETMNKEPLWVVPGGWY